MDIVFLPLGRQCYVIEPSWRICHNKESSPSPSKVTKGTLWLWESDGVPRGKLEGFSKTEAARSFPSHTSPHSASSNSSKLPWCVPTSLWLQQVCSRYVYLSCDSLHWLFSPVLEWQLVLWSLFSEEPKKSHWFWVCSVFSVVKMRVTSSKLFTCQNWNQNLCFYFHSVQKTF